jgi:gliding motility-associated-like protein
MTTNINLIQTNTSNDTTICAGQSLTLTAIGGDNYQWSGGSSATTNSINVTPPSSTNYIVSIASTCGSEIDTITVNVEMPPQFNVSNDTTICLGQNVILSANGSNTYQWSGGSSATTNSINVSPTDTTTYYVTGDANVCGSDTDTIQVNIDQIPSISVSNDTSICLGESVTLIASGFTSYQWSGGNSTTSSSINVNPTTTTNYYVSSSNSCGNDKDTVVVNILPIPTVFAGNDTSICENQSISLNSNTTNAISHSWDNNIMDGVDFIPQIGNNTYTLTATNSFGCTETDQISVTVHPLPNVSAGANISVCDGSLATLTASGANTYSWNNGVNNGVSFSPDSTTQYSVIGTDTFGCINSDSLFLTIIDIPTVDFVGDSLLGCAPLKTIFKNNSIGNLTNCTWTFSDGSTLFGCDSVVKIFTANTCFDVTLTVSTPQGCANTKTINNYVCVKPTPTADFSTSPEELKFDELKANMINSSIYATNYHWIFEDGIGISNEFEPAYTFSYDDSKSYNITLIAINDSSGCSDTITKVIFVNQELIFYVPNTFTPDNNQNNEVFLPIFSSGYDPYGYSLYIFDRWGEILFESHNVKIGWDGTYGGKKVQDGTYIWKINIKKSDTDEHKEFIGHVTLLK